MHVTCIVCSVKSFVFGETKVWLACRLIQVHVVLSLSSVKILS